MTRARVVLVALCAGCFLVLLDVTIVNVALPVGAAAPFTRTALTAMISGADAGP